MPLFGKFLCFAIVALAMDLIWGYAGILSLGHGLFFALGGYAMGMYLMRSIAGEGVYRSALPDFMVFLDWKELPWYWYGFSSFHFALAMALVVPGPAGLRVRLVRLPLAHPGRLLLHRHPGADLRGDAAVLPNTTGFGGNNGLTDFKRILGYSLQRPGHPAGAVRDLGGRAAAGPTWPAASSSPASWAAC